MLEVTERKWHQTCNKNIWVLETKGGKALKLWEFGVQLTGVLYVWDMAGRGGQGPGHRRGPGQTQTSPGNRFIIGLSQPQPRQWHPEDRTLEISPSVLMSMVVGGLGAWGCWWEQCKVPYLSYLPWQGPQRSILLGPTLGTIRWFQRLTGPPPSHFSPGRSCLKHL